MKCYEITIKPLTYTNDFNVVNKTIQAKRINPKAIFKEYYNLEVKSIIKVSKNTWDINASYGTFRLTAFSS